jgi:hypothetical protein
MEGYLREDATVARLVAAIRVVLQCRPHERLGQVLINITRGDDLFNIYDEDLVTKLYEYIEDL